MNKKEGFPGYRICVRCVMDTSDPDILFDNNGVCNHCKQAEHLLLDIAHFFDPDEKEKRLKRLLKDFKQIRGKKRYDCIIGVSGGVDSTYVAYLVKQFRMNPLAIHFDNGWDSELAVQNIENICKKLDIDLFTYVVNWGEFRDLQLAFLKASTPDSEIPTDHGINALLYKMAQKENVKFIITGQNSATESILPQAWSYGYLDWKYIRCIQKSFGTRRFESFPHITLPQYIYLRFVKRIRWLNLLDYILYDKMDAKRIIMRDLGWRDYGGKHHESIYTKFYQSYILPTKFGFDKRRAHLSSLIMARQTTREKALEELKKPLYQPEALKNDIDFVVSKFGIRHEEFEAIMSLPLKRFWDYPSYERSWYYPRMGTRYYNFVRKIYLKYIKRK